MAATLILTEASLAHQPLELQTKVREDFTITEMAPTRAFSHLRHYAKQAPKPRRITGGTYVLAVATLLLFSEEPHSAENSSVKSHSLC